MPDELTMKWQRYRDVGRLPGFCAWVRIGPPAMHDPGLVRGADTGTIQVIGAHEAYETNLLNDGAACFVRADVIELLPEFADDVPLIEFRAAVAEWRGDGQVRQ